MWMAQAIQAIMELDLWFVFFQFDKSNLLPPQYYKGEFNFICKVHIILKKSLLKKVTTAHLIPEIGLITDELGQSLLWTVIWVSRPFSLIFVPISPACVIIFRHLVSSAVLAPCCNPSITIVMLFFLTSWLSFHEMFSYVHWVFIQPVWHNNLHCNLFPHSAFSEFLHAVQTPAFRCNNELLFNLQTPPFAALLLL